MASAAAAPSAEPERDSSEHGVKRRQSGEPEGAGDSKRQRTSPGKNSPTATRDGADGENKTDTTMEEQKPGSPSDTRRKSSTVDEKQRSKRLFGALLGNLRQPGDRTTKRRQEIESRRKAELQRQDDERLEDRQRRQEQLKEQRRIAQVKVHEQNLHRRHRAMLNQANFLKTETEPVLYYRPWQLRDEEEDRIDDQIKDAEDTIAQEVSDFDERKGRKSPPRNGDTIKSNDETERKANSSPVEDDAKEAAGEIVPIDDEHEAGQKDALAKSTAADANANESATDIDATNTEDAKMEDEGATETGLTSQGAADGGEDAEHIQEGDEDAVIY